MRVARLRLQLFRGFESAVFVLDGHTVFAGEPRSGRSDIVEGLRRVLDPRSTRNRVNPLDIFRSTSSAESQPCSDDDKLEAEPIRTQAEADLHRTEVEVTLLDLGAELEDLLDDFLEAFDPETGDVAGATAADEAELGVRLCYRAQYDFDSDTGDHWVDSPARSDPQAESFRKIPRADREALPVLFLDTGTPLQVRAEGAFRALITDADPDALDDVLNDLDEGVRQATHTFSRSDPVSSGLSQVLEAGAHDLIGISSSSSVEFVSDDGTLAALLRALQPAVELDESGVLPLRSHGSTTNNVLTVAEGIAAASAATGELVVVADDFGDQLDASSSEHLAFLLHKASTQVILTTRRPEVVRAFAPSDLVRLTRSHGGRRQHRLGKADKHGRIVRRLALDQLMAALTNRTVALVEGPLDAEGYGALANRLAKKTGLREHSFPANGVRLVSPPGSDGGNTRLVGLARLAGEMGFHVKAVVDGDKPGSSDSVIADLSAVVDQIIVLPPRTAVEAALIRGVSAKNLRKTVNTLVAEGYLDPLPDETLDDEIADQLIRGKVLKKQGIHVAWAYALAEPPPLAQAVIEAICNDGNGRLDILDAE